MDLACSADQSAESLEGGNASYPFNERVHALGDCLASLVIETWPEGAELHRIAAIVQASACGTDMKLPIQATRKMRLGNRQARTWNGPPDGTQPFIAMRERKIAAVFG